MTKSIILNIIILALTCGSLLGQESLLPPKFKSFRGTTLLNVRTTENVPQKGLNFTIFHRFGQADLRNDLLYDFLGMDLTSNIRMGLSLPLNDKVYVGVGRTKYRKSYDFEFSHIILKQDSENKIPVSVSIYENAAISASRFPTVQPDNFFKDRTTLFSYDPKHRWSYLSQVIISRKFGNRFSFLIAPAFVHQNLADPTEINNRWVLPFGGEIKTGLFSSVIFEYVHLFANNKGKDNAYGFGWEYQTASHLFQIFVANKSNIIGQNYYMKPIGADFGRGTFFLGFNLHRTFWIKKQ